MAFGWVSTDASKASDPSQLKSVIEIEVVDGLISGTIQNADLPSVLIEIGKRANIALSIDNKVQGRVSASFSRQPVEQVVERLSRNHAIVFEFDQRTQTYRVVSVSAFAESPESRVNPSDTGENTAPGTGISSTRMPRQATTPSVRHRTIVSIDGIVDSRGRLLYKPGELLIRFKKSTEKAAVEKLNAEIGGQVVDEMAHLNIQKVVLPENLSEGEAMNAYLNSGLVDSVERHVVRYPNAIPNDTLFNQQWGLEKIAAPQGWEATQGAPGVIIAVIDTGVDYLHPDLTSNIWINAAESGGTPGVDDDANGYGDDIYGWDFADWDADPTDGAVSGHGTHVAGIIAASGNNGQGITGVLWQAKIMVLKAQADGSPYLELLSIIGALDYAGTNGAQIVNCSFGGEMPSNLEQEAFQRLQSRGVMAVCAAGNNGADVDIPGNELYPASYEFDNILSVAATTENDDLAWFSNWGVTSVDVAAPGVNILSTLPVDLDPSGAYGTKQGTSMAAPFVAGTAGLLLAIQPSLTPAQMASFIMDGVDQLPSLEHRTVSGGRVNMRNSLCLVDPLAGNIDCAGVLPPVAISNAPVLSPTVEAGESFETTLEVTGGSGEYEWQVTHDPSGTFSGAWLDQDTFSFVAPNTGSYAGVYTITVRDKNYPTVTDTFLIKVPFTVSPNALVFTETTLNGDDNPVDFEISGASSSYAWEILASSSSLGPAPSETDFGQWAKAGLVHNDNTNTFIPANVEIVKKFYVRVTVDNDPDLTDANGLNQRVVGPFTIVPVAPYTIDLSDAEGLIDGSVLDPGDIDVEHIGSGTVESLQNANGRVTFLLPATGGVYKYQIRDQRVTPAYVNRTISSNEMFMSVILEKRGIDSITGTVEDTTGNSIDAARIVAMIPSTVNDILPILYETTTDATGDYTIDLPVGAVPNGWTVSVSKDGYVTVNRIDQTAGIVDFLDVDGNGLQQKTKFESVSATVNPGTGVQVDITVSPAFSNTAQVDIELLSAGGTGALDAPSLSGDTISVVYDAEDEDFSILIKADTTEDGLPITGYFASRPFHFLAEDNAVETEQVDIDAGGPAIGTVGTQQVAEVSVPVGGVSTSATIVMKQVAKVADTASTKGSPDYLYEVDALDNTTGDELPSADIVRVEITLPIDLSIVGPGDLENGIFVIYHGNSVGDIASGNASLVPVSRIINSDYIGVAPNAGQIGSVTFWTESLSAFSVGGPPPTITVSVGSAGGGGGGGCFIATAAYGSMFEPHVIILREFRDRYLLPNTPGKYFVKIYRRYSPPIAEVIAGNDFLRSLVRIALTPVIGFSYLMLHAGIPGKLIMLALATLLFWKVGVAVGRRRHLGSQLTQL